MVRSAFCLALAAVVLVGAAPTRHDGAEERSLRLGGIPLQIVSGRGSLWVVTCDRRCSGEGRRSTGRVIRIDPRRGRVTAAAALQRPGAIAVAEFGVFVTDFWRDSVRRFDPGTLRETASLKLVLPRQIRPRRATFLPTDLALGANAVWVSTEWCALARVDQRLSRVVALVRLPCDAYQTMGAGAGAIWITESLAGLYRVDVATNRVVARIHVGPLSGRLVPTRLLFARGAILAVGIWTQGGVSTRRNGLARIDPTRNRVIAVTQLPSGPLAVAYGKGSLWVARIGGSSVDRVDPSTGRLLRRFDSRIGVALAVAGQRALDGLARRDDSAARSAVGRERRSRRYASQDHREMDGSTRCRK